MIKLTVTGEHAVIIASVADDDHGISIFQDQSNTIAMSYLHDETQIIDVEATQVISVSNPKPNTLRRLWRRLCRVAAHVVQSIRRVLSTPKRADKPKRKTLRSRYRYTGQHRVQANAFGRYRSTNETNLQLRVARAKRSSGTLQEGELSQDIMFMSWVEDYVQRMRDEGSPTYQPGRHFVCS